MSKYPVWLRKKIAIDGTFYKTRNLLAQYNLATVCESANCPNKFECYSCGKSTVMIMGRNCTRACLFCRVEKTGKPESVDSNEPERIARWVKDAGLRFVVITSVTRDDLPDGGSEHFRAVAHSVKQLNPSVNIELLIPDFLGDKNALEKVCLCPADIIGHNIETVRRLYGRIRPKADYDRSIYLLKEIKKRSLNVRTKSSMILGIGENTDEIKGAIKDIADAGCDILVLGQYLQSGRKQIEVDRFLLPEEFERLKETALNSGIGRVYSGPWFRSSYRAEEMADCSL